ncbi:MAG TPA: hypothetical protein VEZ17_01900 [Chitinophagaceae bacterium]|jgi:hypothetical protein|nr:hypothetical protein [Chitinophagaceae bacterium]
MKENLVSIKTLDGANGYINKNLITAIFPFDNGLRVVVGSIGYDLQCTMEEFFARL